jgi:uncharacterized protein YkwD
MAHAGQLPRPPCRIQMHHAAATALRKAAARAPLRTSRRAALFLFIALLGVAVGLSGGSTKPVAAAIQTGDCTQASSWPANNGSLDSQVMSLINQHRASLGLGQLVTSPTLTASAVWKARQMAQYGYFSHDDVAPPVARTAGDRISTCGYHYSWGENIAEGFPDAASVVNAWLNSAGHKANIENPSFVATGLGAAQAANGAIYWVQDFGFVADGGSPPPTTTSSPPQTTTHVTTTTPPPTTTRTTTTSPTTTSRTTTSRTTTSTKTTTTAPTTTAPGPKKAAPAGALALTSFKVGTAGARRLVLTTKVVHSGKPVSSASVKCAAVLGKRHLRVVMNAFRAGRAHCAWRLPGRLSAGSFANGWVSVRDGSSRGLQAFAVKVR